MQYNSFGRLLWSSLLHTWGAVLSLLGFFGMIIGYFVVPSADTIPLRWYIVSLFAAAWVIIILARATWLVFEQSVHRNPTVRYAQSPPLAFSNAVALLLLDATPMLAQGALVSIYYLENEVERLAGLGKVINVQNDGRVQVLILADYGFGSKIDAIKLNSVDELRRLIVKNVIPEFVLKEYANAS